MAISRVSAQDTAANSSTTSVTATYPGPTTAGNLLIAYGVSNGNTFTISGSGSWTTLITSFQSLSNANPMNLYCKLADGTETSITASSISANLMTFSMVEYTGNANPLIFDGTPLGQNNGGASVTTYTTPLITTICPNDLIFSVLTTTAATGFSWVTNTIVDANTAGTFRTFGGENIVISQKKNFQDTANWTGAHSAGSMICAFSAPRRSFVPSNIRPHPFSPGLAR